MQRTHWRMIMSRKKARIDCWYGRRRRGSEEREGECPSLMLADRVDMGEQMRWHSALGFASTEPCRALDHFPDLWGSQVRPSRRARMLVGRGWRTKEAFLFLVQQQSRITARWHADSAWEPCERSTEAQVSDRSVARSCVRGGHCMLRRRCERRANGRETYVQHAECCGCRICQLRAAGCAGAAILASPPRAAP
jgi:hypothetical protein